MIFKLEGTESEINSIINKLNQDKHEVLVEQDELFKQDNIDDVISITNDFSKNLRLLRKHSKHTQKQLGNKLNIPFRTILNWERSVREPSVKNLLIVARFFEVDPFTLYGSNILDKQDNEYGIDVNNYFPENLKLIRKAKGMTQKQFAEFVGIKLKTVINYENSVRLPNYEGSKKIATKLNVDPFMLVGKGKKENENS